jgi:hypothetical protein
MEATTRRAEPGQALAIIVPTTVLPAGRAASSMLAPRLIADAGESASLRFLDFFTANIRNPNTRAAYAVALRAFFAWLDGKRVAPLAAVRTHHVSAYVEVLGRGYRAPTVKQHLAANPHAVRLADRGFLLECVAGFVGTRGWWRIDQIRSYRSSKGANARVGADRWRRSNAVRRIEAERSTSTCRKT